MNTGSLGTFVMSWSQTEVDGLKAAGMENLTVGAVWRWSGQAVRVDGPSGVLRLDGAEGASELRAKAARMVRRLIGGAVASAAAPSRLQDDRLQDRMDQGFIVTDGRQSYSVTVIAVPDTGARLLMVMGGLPPVDQDLWVVRSSVHRSASAAGCPASGGVICFTPDTRIATPCGAQQISTLRPGDLVLTRDNGPQPVLWMGFRRMSGARLYAMPHLRPIRFKKNAMGLYRPEEDLLVSPQHRMLLTGAAAQALFNTPEVLVAAEDLINDSTIMVDHQLMEVTYVHILLEQHNVVWANGLETESFHPSATAIETLDPAQLQGLKAILPQIEVNPHSYGDYARRNLSGSEAAILRYELAA
jgi:hypothetical protein